MDFLKSILDTGSDKNESNSSVANLLQSNLSTENQYTLQQEKNDDGHLIYKLVPIHNPNESSKNFVKKDLNLSSVATDISFLKSFDGTDINIPKQTEQKKKHFIYINDANLENINSNNSLSNTFEHPVISSSNHLTNQKFIILPSTVTNDESSVKMTVSKPVITYSNGTYNIQSNNLLDTLNIRPLMLNSDHLNGSLIPLVNSFKEEKRRNNHNEVERRRRDKINTWINKLAQMLPPELSRQSKQGMSKSGILAKTVDYIFDLKQANENLFNALKTNEDAALECERLRLANRELLLKLSTTKLNRNSTIREIFPITTSTPPTIKTLEKSPLTTDSNTNTTSIDNKGNNSNDMTDEIQQNNTDKTNITPSTDLDTAFKLRYVNQENAALKAFIKQYFPNIEIKIARVLTVPEDKNSQQPLLNQNVTKKI